MWVFLPSSALAVSSAVVNIKLNEEEQAGFDNSVNAVKGLIEACKGIDGSLA